MPSLWTASAQLPQFPTLHGDIKTDVLVIGGGMAGILCAYELQQSGIDCTLVETGRLACGITKNTTAKLTSQHGLIYHKLIKQKGQEAAGIYLEANERALSHYRVLCAPLDCDFSDQSNFIFSTDRPDLLDAELSALSSLHFPAEYVSELPMPFKTAGAVKFSNQAQFHPLKFLAGIVPDLRIYENTNVRGLADHVAVTDSGIIRAEKIIIATHFPFLNKHGSFFLKMYQQRSYVLALENTPDLHGMYLDEAENGFSFRMHGNKLLLGGGGHRTGNTGGGWNLLTDFARIHYPGARITHRWAAQDCMTLDGIPYVGQYSKRTPNLYVTTGFNKWGMTNAMVGAQILADLVQGKRNPYAEVFSPSRSMLHPQLGLNILESTKNLLSFSPKRCPHLGCALKWNPQEHSWDCPCHGSRFDADGGLLDNPATGDLKKRE